MEGYHKSVLFREAIKALEVNRGKWYLDLTLGDGGHSLGILARGGKVIGIDVDPQALERVQKRFRDEGVEQDKYRLIKGNFRDIENLIQSSFAKATEDKQTELNDLKFDGAKLRLSGAIFDLGVSSLQLMSPERGFSFAKMGPLDMRMDPDLGIRALDLLNVLSRKELYELFQNLGEEKYSKRLAGALVSAREITTTTELADIIEKAIGKSGKIHPATRVFQALRIAVNDELSALEEGLDSCLDLIEKDGRIVVISFHSLEDRIVKNTFKKWQLGGNGEILTRKPIVPGELETEENPRSRSAKMRVFKKM